MSKKNKNQLIIDDNDSEDEVEVESISDQDEVEEDLNSELSDDEEIEIEENDEELADDKDDDFDEDQSCYIKNELEDDDVETIEYLENMKSKQVPDEERLSSSKMTRYEFNRILGTRMQQLISNAKPMIHNIDNLGYDEIAILEIKNNVIPFKIKRPLPNGMFEIWKISELRKDHFFI
jgi:DNA-directed RNA polymerase subunit K/omega